MKPRNLENGMMRAALGAAFVMVSALVVTVGEEAAAVAQTTTATPERDLSIERFRIATDRQGILDVEGGWTEKAGSWNGNIWGNYANDPLVIRDADSNQRLGSLIHHRIDGGASFAVSVLDQLQLAVSVPFVLWQSGQQDVSGVAGLPTAALATTGLGNIRFSPKLALYQSENRGFGLSFLAHIVFPAPQTDGYFGDNSFGVEPELAVGTRAGAVRLAANGSYHWRAKDPQVVGTTIHDELTGRAGAALRFGGLHDDWGGPFEADLSTVVTTAANSIFGQKSQDAVEVAGALQYDTLPFVTLYAGGGLGVAPAYGVPDYHLFAGVRVFSIVAPPPHAEPSPLDDDPDRDGIVGAADRCPMQPEDKDGFEDTDGCPDPDNDHDGVADVDDACPNKPGSAENKGCPDLDSDGDGIMDRLDKCPQEPEDKDGFEDADGCPDPDNDKDGILDADDACPNEAGIIQNKGCPDKDRDGDGVVDRLDNCPDEPGPAANDGCKAKQLAHITDTGIEIRETVYFKTDRDLIEKASFALLDNVALVIGNHPEAGVIRIEGHTDDQGDDKHNQTLSEHRAQAVLEYLAKKGIPRDRLTATGYGETKPIADNKTVKGRAQNRRVVFARASVTTTTQP